MTGRGTWNAIAVGGLALSTIVATGCGGAAQRTGGTGQDVPGDVLWSEEVQLTSYEVQFFDSRNLEIHPIDIGVDSAVIEIRLRGITHRFELRTTGPLSTEVQPPYHFELLETSPTPSITLRVTKFSEDGEGTEEPDAQRIP